jgi:hypothetical protein
MRWLFVILLASSSPLAGAAAGPVTRGETAVGTLVGGQSRPYALRGDELAAVRDTACAAYGVASESIGPALRWTYGGRFTPTVEVAVRCAPHARVNDRPSHYNVECRRDDDRRDRQWQCHGWRAILVPTRIGDLSIEPGPYDNDFATRTVRAALASSLFQREVREALSTGCRLAANWDGQGEEIAELSCASGHRFLFSFWCPQRDCPRLMTAISPNR